MMPQVANTEKIEHIDLQQLCNWAMYLHQHHNEIDADQLTKTLIALNLETAWQPLAAAAV